jgi:hypothetical protein
LVTASGPLESDGHQTRRIPKTSGIAVYTFGAPFSHRSNSVSSHYIR